MLGLVQCVQAPCSGPYLRGHHISALRRGCSGPGEALPAHIPCRASSPRDAVRVSLSVRGSPGKAKHRARREGLETFLSLDSLAPMCPCHILPTSSRGFAEEGRTTSKRETWRVGGHVQFAVVTGSAGSAEGIAFASPSLSAACSWGRVPCTSEAADIGRADIRSGQICGRGREATRPKTPQKEGRCGHRQLARSSGSGFPAPAEAGAGAGAGDARDGKKSDSWNTRFKFTGHDCARCVTCHRGCHFSRGFRGDRNSV